MPRMFCMPSLRPRPSSGSMLARSEAWWIARRTSWLMSRQTDLDSNTDTDILIIYTGSARVTGSIIIYIGSARVTGPTYDPSHCYTGDTAKTQVRHIQSEGVFSSIGLANISWTFFGTQFLPPPKNKSGYGKTS